LSLRESRGSKTPDFGGTPRRSITDRLAEIDVPTLLISGQHDEATPQIVQEIDERIPNSRWILFENSSHTPHLEEPDKFIEALNQFLADVEADDAARPPNGAVDEPTAASPTA
jgi:pimeloyl-ACP methyl ester carboxylesterase